MEDKETNDICKCGHSSYAHRTTNINPHFGSRCWALKCCCDTFTARNNLEYIQWFGRNRTHKILRLFTNMFCNAISSVNYTIRNIWRKLFGYDFLIVPVGMIAVVLALVGVMIISVYRHVIERKEVIASCVFTCYASNGEIMYKGKVDDYALPGSDHPSLVINVGKTSYFCDSGKVEEE